MSETEEFLIDLKKKLQNAEESMKYSLPDKSAALDGYLHLAEMFYNDYQDYIVSAYFYKRVIHVAKQYNVWGGPKLYRKSDSKGEASWATGDVTTRCS